MNNQNGSKNKLEQNIANTALGTTIIGSAITLATYGGVFGYLGDYKPSAEDLLIAAPYLISSALGAFQFDDKKIGTSLTDKVTNAVGNMACAPIIAGIGYTIGEISKYL